MKRLCRIYQWFLAYDSMFWELLNLLKTRSQSNSVLFCCLIPRLKRRSLITDGSQIELLKQFQDRSPSLVNTFILLSPLVPLPSHYLVSIICSTFFLYSVIFTSSSSTRFDRKSVILSWKLCATSLSSSLSASVISAILFLSKLRNLLL